MEDRNIIESNKSTRGKKSGNGLIILALIFAIIGGVIGSAFTSYCFYKKFPANSENSSKNITINASDVSTVASAVAKKSMPSVVGITTTGVQPSFFGPVQVQGMGSGIVFDDKGYIVTNAHVVKLNNQVVDKVNVQLDKDVTVEGKPIWVDENVDLAVVKVNTKEKLVPAELGDSDKLNIGDVAIAIGNPISLQFSQTVTQGIISGLNRYVGQVSGGGYMMGLIQTDASINGGNSGGALLNAQGQVIGINTVKVQSAEGLGFAIPINYVKTIINQVVKNGDYKELSLGVYSADAQYANQIIGKDLGIDEGIFILKVFDNSPAKTAGLEVGDVITKLGDDKIKGVKDLKAALYKYQEGDKVTITYIREGKEKQTELTFTNYRVPVSEKPKEDKKTQENFENRQDQGQNSQGNYDESDPFNQYREYMRSFFGE